MRLEQDDTEEEFIAMMKCSVAFGHWTIEEMREYMDNLRDKITTELMRK